MVDDDIDMWDDSDLVKCHVLKCCLYFDINRICFSLMICKKKEEGKTFLEHCSTSFTYRKVTDYIKIYNLSMKKKCCVFIFILIKKRLFISSHECWNHCQRYKRVYSVCPSEDSWIISRNEQGDTSGLFGLYPRMRFL
jgi:hypothetical protein